MHLLQLLVLAIYLRLLGLHHLTLGPLIVGIFAHETQTTIHLRHVLGGENKHQFILHRLMAGHVAHGDRKSTRLNSSHANISYAVFCLKKKKTITYSANS